MKNNDQNPHDNRAHVAEAASELLNEGKKLAQENAKEFSEKLAQQVKENPLASILIAGGVGFLLSALLRK